MPLGLVSDYAASRRGEHWRFTDQEQRALAEALAAVANELIPLLPVLDDSPLAAACTQLVLTTGTVLGGRLYLDYMILQAARRQAAEAEAAQQAHQVVQFPGAAL